MFSILPTEMMFRLATSFSNTGSTLLVTSFLLAMFWCGNSECALGGKGTEQYGVLMYSLLNRNADHSSNSKIPASEGTTLCSCVCHSPTVSSQINWTAYSPAPQINHRNYSFIIFSTPIRLIYHPPKAA